MASFYDQQNRVVWHKEILILVRSETERGELRRVEQQVSDRGELHSRFLHFWGGLGCFVSCVIHIGMVRRTSVFVTRADG